MNILDEKDLLKTVVQYDENSYKCEIFKETNLSEENEKCDFIAIEFPKGLPFKNVKRKFQHGEESEYGYIVELEKGVIKDIYLLVTDYGFMETETIEYDSEEYRFVISILEEAGVL